MLRLSEPCHTFAQSLDDCGAGIAAYVPLQGKLANSKEELLVRGERYTQAGREGRFCSIAPFLGQPQDVVLVEMTKRDLLKVYDQYFVPEEKIARRIYNSIMNAARERCPFCGIGTPGNLDHYLPKAYFPQFAVLPMNLVPACRDCNLGAKVDSIAIDEEDQPIHPYLDAEKFFGEQWVFARYNDGPAGEPGEFEYFASPPRQWPLGDQEKASRHFEKFGLAKRYSVRAAEYLPTVFSQIERLTARGLGRKDIEDVLLEPGVAQAPFANHWQRGMFQALMQHAGS